MCFDDSIENVQRQKCINGFAMRVKECKIGAAAAQIIGTKVQESGSNNLHDIIIPIISYIITIFVILY